MKHTISVTIILAMAINLISCGKSSQVSKVTNNAKKDVEILAPASDQATITAFQKFSSCSAVEKAYPGEIPNASLISESKDAQWESKLSPALEFFIKDLYKSTSGSEYDESFPIKTKVVTIKGDKKQTPYLLAQVGEDTQQLKYEFLIYEIDKILTTFPISFKGDTTCLDINIKFEKDSLFSQYLKLKAIKFSQVEALESHKKALAEAENETEKEEIEAKIKESGEKLKSTEEELTKLQQIADERGIKLPTSKKIRPRN